MVPSGIVCVFAKAPVPGAAKTRLARSIGEVSAARLAEAFLLDTCDLVRASGVGRLVIAGIAHFP